MNRDEREWLRGTNYDRVLWSLYRAPFARRGTRPYRCFAVASVRLIWEHLTGPQRHAVEASEFYLEGYYSNRQRADARAKIGLIPTDILGTADAVYWATAAPTDIRVSCHTAANYVRQVVTRSRGREAGAALDATYIAFLRDLFGNPFRPAHSVIPAWRRWNRGAVVRVAEDIAAKQAFEHLPILADALEEAGCTDAAILGHCRGPGPHVRGCWVVDLLRGQA